ncbi:Cysteine proteinase [Babesia sp. Xinjiang]|uniref:Cysteine proteinase n=1 Tax=Babesia sp. Xinjiang TaxID=462227 RepID=UPI000A21DA89|nr:Cysteine proteinase [Babesia sp. Xinjiang]ORM40605.1 Cysteine proteinase [Babesia sp. Xinjiang]
MAIPTADSDLSNPDDHYVRSEEMERDTALITRPPQHCRFHRKIVYIFVISALIGAALSTGIFALIKWAGRKPTHDGEMRKGVKGDIVGSRTPSDIVSELSEMHHLGGISVTSPCEVAKFMEFKRLAQLYKKEYDDITAKHAGFLKFRRNLEAIEEHKKNRQATYTKGLNHLFDMDIEEITAKLFPRTYVDDGLANINVVHPHVVVGEDNKSKYTALKGHGEYTNIIKLGENVTFENVDWRNVGGVSEVKDQGLCGSCWAFAAVGAVESAFKIERKIHVSLSEQELVNCETGGDGCYGGYSDLALSYIRTNGIGLTNVWPYEGKDGECVPHDGARYYITGYVGARGIEIASKLLVRAPTVVYIAATDDLMFYSGGIFNGDCEGTHLNHAVLLVGEGYDPELKKRFWLLKNSWGTSWGENGFFRLERTGTDTDKCGVLSFGYMPYGTY